MDSSSEFLTNFGPEQFFNLVEKYSKKTGLTKPDNFDEIWDDVKSKIHPRGYPSTIRSDLLEVSLGAKGQCLSIGMTHPTSSDKCWLCNLEFGQQDFYKNPAYYAQCEHLLPSAVGFMLFGIPTDKKSTDDLTSTFLKPNYSWAHAECNVIKRDLLFLTIIKGNNNIATENEIKLNVGVINSYVNKVWEKSKENSPVYHYKESNKENDPSGKIFKENAKLSIYEKLSPLIESLQRNIRINMLINADLLLQNIHKINTKIYEYKTPIGSDPKTPKLTGGPMRRTPKKLFNSPEDLRPPFTPRDRTKSKRNSIGGQKRNKTRRVNKH